MFIDMQKVPEREGWETLIHLCSECPEHEAENCEVEKYHIQGWCYTFKDIK